MTISLKRAYETPSAQDGYRVLVDRLWPRGVSADRLAADEWLKDAAPSDRLRASFHAGDLSWGEFRKRYLAELRAHRGELRRLAAIAKRRTVTLLFAAHDVERNNAVVMRQYLRMLGAG